MALSCRRKIEGVEKCPFPLPLSAPLYLRSLRVWSVLKKWTRKMAPHIRQDLVDGSEDERKFNHGEDWMLFCKANGVSPDRPSLQAFRMLHAVCDGQLSWSMHGLSRKFDEDEVVLSGAWTTRTACEFRGLFGGYSVYEHTPCSFLLPLKESAWLSTCGEDSLAGNDHSKLHELCQNARLDSPLAPVANAIRRKLGLSRIAVAASGTQKITWLDPLDGAVYVGDPACIFPREMGLLAEHHQSDAMRVLNPVERDFLRRVPWRLGVRAAPTRENKFLNVDDRGMYPHPEYYDDVLRWTECFAERLRRGFYRASPIVPDDPDSVGVVLFPRTEEAPMGMTPISRITPPLPEKHRLPTRRPDAGATVAVTRGVVCTASPIMLAESPRGGWAYSIRLRLDPDAAAAANVVACRLDTRHWRIVDGEGVVRDVNGRGVIGKFPFLYSGGWRDDYQGYAGLTGPHRRGEFVYQSQSGPLEGVDPDSRLEGVEPGRGSFGGELQMIPGRWEDDGEGQKDLILGSQDETFDVVVKPFELSVPAFVF